ncbi:MAG TPA: hypothetical protein V6D06_04670 [Trichocoleus sp.]
MDSRDWAQYIESTDGISKPWLLVQWRLKMLQERRTEMAADEYQTALAELHQDLMNLGEWWKGQEEEVFGLGSEDRGNR